MPRELKDVDDEIVRKMQAESKRKPSLLELEGLGKKIWKDIDVDDYINKERNSWS